MSFEFREYVFIVRQHRAATAPESPLDLNQYWWFGKMGKKTWTVSLLQFLKSLMFDFTGN